MKKDGKRSVREPGALNPWKKKLQRERVSTRAMSPSTTTGAGGKKRTYWQRQLTERGRYQPCKKQKNRITKKTRGGEIGGSVVRALGGEKTGGSKGDRESFQKPKRGIKPGRDTPMARGELGGVGELCHRIGKNI